MHNGKVRLWTAYLLAVAALAALIACYALDTHWLPTDEGFYALMAERFLAGEVPHRDFQVGNHPGLDLWINTLAMKAFGLKLSSLRWPVALLVLLATFPVFCCLAPRPPVTVFLTVLWVGVVCFPAMPSPSASALSTTFILGAMAQVRRGSLFTSRQTVFGVGLLLGLAFACRQLGAGFAGCALLSWGLSQERAEGSEGASRLGRALLVLSACCLTLYVLSRSDLVGKLLFGLPGIGLLWQAAVVGRPSPSRTRHLVVPTSLGFLTALLPLASYYAYHGALTLWLRDVFVSSLGQASMTFEQDYRYSAVIGGLFGAYPQVSLWSHLQLFTWLALFLCPTVVAIAVFRRQARGEKVEAYIFCGPVMAACALHFEIMIYLLWALPLPVLGLCAVAADRWKWRGQILLAVCLLAFINSAVGRPVWLRTDEDLVAAPWGARPPLGYLDGKADLKVELPYVEFYQRSLDLIAREVSPTETILSIPFGAEWYFLSGRANPTPWSCLALALRSQSDLKRVQEVLLLAPPRMVIFRIKDKYNTPWTLELRRWLQGSYQLIKSDSGYEFLVRTQETSLSP